ncbi:MAG: M55 family metallopeptidase [Firmicutes bacterium]|nr:M55 family metallopeptidase [Bacillota bacterium]
MKIFISADIEGITGVTSWSETEYGGEGYEAACRLMTAETAAACKAAADMGCDVVVKDAHGSGLNINIEGLPVGTRLIRGWRCSPEAMMGGLDSSFDGVVYIGYHAPSGSDGSPLAHTVDRSIAAIKVNGKLASEFTLNCMYADSIGVPSLLISGDEYTCLAAADEYSGIETVSTKSCVGNSTYNRHPEEVKEEIYRKVQEAVKNIEDKSIDISNEINEEINLEISYRECSKAREASWYPGAILKSPNTVEYKAENINDFMTAKKFLLEV